MKFTAPTRSRTVSYTHLDVYKRQDDEGGVISDINTTPLVDVMLVLLIIFLITIPVLTKNVPVKVPKAVNIPTQTKPETVSYTHL